MRVNPKKLELHPEAHRVPEMQADEYKAFLDDVREHGIRVPIETMPGTLTVIDGRTRLKAALEAGIKEVPVVDATILDDESPALFMLRAAVMRRHLSSSQRAALAVEIKDQKAVEAKERQRKQAKINQPQAKSLNPEIIPDSEKGEARDEAAKEYKTNPHYVSDAAKLKEEDPEIFEEVKAGTKSIPKAKKQARERKLPAKPTRKKDELKDELGVDVPDELRDLFGDPCLDESAAALGELMGKLKTVRRIVQTKGTAYSFLLAGDILKAIDSAKDELETAKAHLLEGKPYAVCTKCNGKGCRTHCRPSAGWLPKWKYMELKKGGDL